MHPTLRLIVLTALILSLGLQACDLAAFGEALDSDDDHPTARHVLAQLGATPGTATLESVQLEASYLAAAAGDPERRRLHAALEDNGCTGGEPAAYRTWSDRTDVVVVDEAMSCPGQPEITLVTFLEASRPNPVASCWLTGGDDAANGMVYAVAPDGRIVGTPRIIRVH